MEDFIIYAVIIISIIVNIYRNYQKQKEKDSKRVAGKPTPSQTAKPISIPTPVSKPVSKPTTTIKAQPETKKSEIELAIEKIKKENPELAYKYSSIESSSSLRSSIDTTSSIFDLHDEISAIEENAFDDKQKTNKISSLFETKDDFKKAILYNTILERKYN